jgi:hypothetical protein
MLLFSAYTQFWDKKTCFIDDFNISLCHNLLSVITSLYNYLRVSASFIAF